MSDVMLIVLIVVFLSLAAVRYVLPQVPCLRACVRTSPGHKVTASSNHPTVEKTSLSTSQSELLQDFSQCITEDDALNYYLVSK